MFNSKKRINELETKIRELESTLEQEKLHSKDLVANVSHELRTPISAIMAVIENLTIGITPWTPAVGKQILGYTDKLADLVSFLLDLSKVDSGRSELHISKVKIGDFIEQCIEPLQMQDASKNLMFTINVNPFDLECLFDEKRMNQAITNIVSNAIRFSPQNGTVFLDIYQEEREVIINIIDQGPGIDAEVTDKIFERFNHGALANDIETNKFSGGTGIGLSIARWVVQLHKGDISVIGKQDTPDGYGAIFEIRLPIL